MIIGLSFTNKPESEKSYGAYWPHFDEFSKESGYLNRESEKENFFCNMLIYASKQDRVRYIRKLRSLSEEFCFLSPDLRIPSTRSFIKHTKKLKRRREECGYEVPPKEYIDFAINNIDNFSLNDFYIIFLNESSVLEYASYLDTYYGVPYKETISTKPEDVLKLLDKYGVKYDK